MLKIYYEKVEIVKKTPKKVHNEEVNEINM